MPIIARQHLSARQGGLGEVRTAAHRCLPASPSPDLQYAMDGSATCKISLEDGLAGKAGRDSQCKASGKRVEYSGHTGDIQGVYRG